MQSPELWNPVLISFYPTAAAASIAINTATLQTAFQQAGAESFTSGLQGIWGFGMPKTPASWGYSVAILLYLATGGLASGVVWQLCFCSLFVQLLCCCGVLCCC